MSFTYQVRIRGRLSRTLSGEFEDLGLVADVAPVETTLHGSVVDQAALYGLIRRLEALGLELVELRRVQRDPDDDPPGGAIGGDRSGASGPGTVEPTPVPAPEPGAKEDDDVRSRR
jgi:hypothetical protein